MGCKLDFYYKIKTTGPLIRPIIKTNIMKESLTILHEYAIASDNLWLASKLQLLEKEIKIEILKEKLLLLDKFSEEQNLILNEPN